MPSDSAPSDMVAFQGALYFANTTQSTGRELWKTDGTPQGTTLLRDINPGPVHSRPANLTVVGDTLFFTAYDAVNGTGLWKTDGTVAGTVPVADTPSVGTLFAYLVDVRGTLLFMGLLPNGQGGLFRSDGTAGGTVLLHSFDADPGISNAAPYRRLPGAAVLGDTLYFQAFDVNTRGMELWKSDGTVDGTVLVKDINPSTTAGYAGAYPTHLTVSGGRLFFTAADGTHGTELWVSDGTADGTVMVRDVVAGNTTGSGGPSNPPEGPYDLAPLNGGVVFRTPRSGPLTSPNPWSGPNVWFSDGTAAGTVPLLEAGANNKLPGALGPPADTILTVGGMTYFTARDGSELWRTDGAPAGTALVKRFAVGSAARFLRDFSGTLVFRADDGTSGSELWRSDGTEDGTTPLADVAPGAAGSDPLPAAALNGRVLFHANDGNGRALWETDLASRGATLVARHDNGTIGSAPAYLRASGGTVFFSADDGAHGRTLWKSDGTAAGTALVKDFDPGTTDSVRPALAINGRVIVEVSYGVGRTIEAWTTDGTPDGTVRFPLSPNLNDPGVERDGLLYFLSEAPGDRALARTDGTPGGTSVIKAVPGSYLSQLTELNGSLYFVTRDTRTSRTALWRSDGTPTGTAEVTALAGYTSTLTSAGNSLFFSVHDTVARRSQLWKSDGTAAGTVLVRQFGVGSDGSLDDLAALEDVLLFDGFDETTGNELWTSDGTPEGTVRLEEFNPSMSYSGIGFLEAVDGVMFFRTNAGLWRTDGTEAGTFMLAERVYPDWTANLNGTLYFAATGGGVRSAPELWRSDGTVTGTQSVQVLPRGDGSVKPPYATVIGNVVYFAANEGVHGYELWKYTPDVVPQPARVVGRQVFYNNSFYDGGDAAADARDDGAIAPDKAALLPGQAGTFANVSTYARGINGVMVDVAGLPTGADLDAGDFLFEFGGAPAPAPSSLTVRRGAGVSGSDRVSVTWADGRIRNGWLRVTMKASERTGLAAPDIFSFGHLAGETGDAPANPRVNALDLAAVKRPLGSTAAIDSRLDLNRDGRINALDLAAVRASLSLTLAVTGLWDEQAAPVLEQVR